MAKRGSIQDSAGTLMDCQDILKLNENNNKNNNEMILSTKNITNIFSLYSLQQPKETCIISLPFNNKRKILGKMIKVMQ